MRIENLALANRIQQRLRALSERRESTQEYEEAPSLLYDPPVSSIRPIASIGLGFVVVIAAFAWLHRPTPVAEAGILNSGVNLAVPSVSSEIVVDVEGDVNKPGLVHLPLGSRMADAIAAAQGMKDGVDTTTVNLASRLEDGQLIVIGKPSNMSQSMDTRISLNQGTQADFDSLPGVGPVLAGRIVAYRDQHHQFTSIDQLQEVPGIGPKVFANLKPLIKL